VISLEAVAHNSNTFKKKLKTFYYTNCTATRMIHVTPRLRFVSLMTEIWRVKRCIIIIIRWSGSGRIEACLTTIQQFGGGERLDLCCGAVLSVHMPGQDK